jgi:hypothetical protein
MRRLAALLAIGAMVVTAAPAAFAQNADDDDDDATTYQKRGGYQYYDDGSIATSQYDLFVERFGSYGNTPDFDNRSTWERVQSDPHSSTVGVSGL